MTDNDLHTLTGAFAANALPFEEEIEFAAHLRECKTCPEEVSGLVETTARLAQAAAEPAPAALRESVLAAIRVTRQLSPLDVPVSLHDVRRAAERRRWYQQPVGLAASILAAASVGLGAVAVDAHRRADRAERIAAIVTDPGAVTRTATAPGGARAKVVAADGNGVFSVAELDPLDEDRDYQLWVIGEEGEQSARSVGVLERGSNGVVEHFIPGLDPGETVGVTIEPKGGSDKPTTPPLVVVPVNA